VYSIISSPPSGTKEKRKKRKVEDKEDPLDEFLQKFVPPTLDDIPSPDLEFEESKEDVTVPQQEVQKEIEEPSVFRKPPRPVKSKKPISSRPPAPRPLPISTKSKKTKSSSVAVSKDKKQKISDAKLDEEPILSKTDEKQRNKKTARISGQLLKSLETEPNLLLYFEHYSNRILERPSIEGWPWVKSKKVMIPPKLVTQWKTQGSLLAAIASLEFFHYQQSKGEISPDLYHRQLKSLVMEALHLLIRLEKNDSFSFEVFIERENIAKYFPQGLEKLRLAEGSSDLDSLIDGQKINYQELVKLPTKAADYVANGIELMDLIRLKAIATIDRILPLLDEMQGILKVTDDIFGEDYWVLAEINAWRKKLAKEDPGTLLPDKDLEKLEMQAVRWMNDFRRELKNI
jgi:hypothetical protein